MEMMTQLPFPKTHAGIGDSCKSSKSPKKENEGAEVVSFPTMLENSAKALVSTGNSKTPAESLVKDTAPFVKEIAGAGETTETTETIETTDPKSLAVVIAAMTSEVATENIPEGALIATDGKISTPDIKITELKINETVQEIAASTIAKGASEEQVVAAKPIAASAEVIPESKETAAPEGLPKIIDELKASEIIKTVEAGKVATIINEPKTPVSVNIETAPEEEDDDTAVKAELKSGKIPVASALVDDKQAMPKVASSEAQQQPQGSIPVAEDIKMEIVKEAPAAQLENTPAVENPVISRQSSAELDLLSAQANAQKTYQQPTVSQEQAGTVKPTLADLDLDSGSFESNEQKEQSISRILSSLNETSTSSVKRSIRGQVLSRVVEHLQEEIGKEKLTIRLNPEKLGQIEILFQAEGDKLSITMSSQGKDAEQAIQEGTKELAEKITDNSVRYNLVDIKVESKGQDQQTKQDSKQEDKREKQGQSDQQQNEGQPSNGDHNQETGAGEWAAFHLGG